ncbi:AfsR/SARP family transcriptional regulator [Streptomyces aurantiogriseus]|uniref:SARP family transcriptional regulator n=1 Tax=Streptomyces aurantiogriseus TaxID=66870 RepID=A0A918CMZ1_9ACTN|nr:BTAD domain-containing putative transcriptional regulator [Streptomyces aurantiogriseus]GGR29431.1 SARP family transcriptional regulator [Streptomyces aurantiogriseus]
MPLEPVRFAVLGPVRVWRGETELEPGGPQERAFLALLLVRAGQPVAVDEIVDVLWGTRPPRSAVNVVRRHVGSLRRLLEPGLAPRAAGRWLMRDAGGYRLVTDGDCLDLLRFRALREAARRVTGESPVRAVELLTEALSLWQGPVAAGLPEQARAHPAFGAADRERLAAVREAADAALRAGTPDAILPQLQLAATDHPLDEPVQAGLILALAAAGRRPEALGVYDAVRLRLAEELGIDPGPELREAHEAVLKSATADEVSPPAPSAPAAFTAPAQLPYDIPAFTGRHAELDEILALSGGAEPSAGTVVISAIGGMAGVGKTTLAVHWAHRVADRFPDGQLYVNLRGFDPSGAVMEPGEAVRGFLDALGVPPDRVPHGVDAQAALYRSVLAGRRVLVVLDNARDSDHVRPLLPGSPGCLAIVTSRDELSGLVAAHGARALTLRPFDLAQARAFLVGRLGAERVEAEPDAADEIGALCAGLPLALACVAARAAVHPHFPLAAVAAELREAHGSLDAFARSDASVDVSTVFSWSSREVSDPAARLFRLLALHPGPDFSLPAAAALAGLPVRRTRPLLAELTGLHLVTEHSPGRYAFHDLLRAHAAELVDEEHTDDERQAALHRLHHHYLHTAHTADRLLAPASDPLPPPPAPEGVHPEPLADDDQALAWLTAEHAVLLAVVDTAAAGVQERLACHLAWSLEPFFDRRGHWHDGLAVQRVALDAARRLADPVLEARGLRGLGRIEGRLGLHGDAVPRLERALALFTELGDDAGRAHTHRSLGWERDQQGDLPGALRHNQLALDLFRALGDRAAQASVLNSVGWYHALLGEYQQALTHCFEALTMLQELGDRYGQAATWDSIAYAHQHLGRHPHALLGYRNALALLRDLGVPYVEADILTRVGDTHRAMGDHDSARTAWEQALTLLRSLDHPDAERVQARLSGRDGHAGAC